MKSINSLGEQQACISALSEAFIYNKSVRQLCGFSARSRNKIRRLMEYSLATCLGSGRVVSDDSGHAYALILFPDRQKITLHGLLRMLWFVLRISGPGNILRILAREQHLSGVKKAFLGDAPLYYLWFLGVSPSEQGKGHGAALLRELMAEAGSMKRQLVLETSTISNLSFYGKAGLECYHIVEMPFPLYCFRPEA